MVLDERVGSDKATGATDKKDNPDLRLKDKELSGNNHDLERAY